MGFGRHSAIGYDVPIAVQNGEGETSRKVGFTGVVGQLVDPGGLVQKIKTSQFT